MNFRASFIGLLVAALAGCGGAAAPASSASAPVQASAQQPSAAPASASVKPSAPASASASAAPASSGLVKLTVGHSNPIVETVGLYAAHDAGIFQKNGLDVDVRLIAGGSTAMAAVVSGETPFSQLGGSEALGAASGGAEIVVLAITSPTSSFVLDVTNDIKTPQDLKGKRLGISNIGGSSDIALHVALRKLGLDPDKDVNISATGSTANRRAALESGALQGAMELPADAVALESHGFWRMLDQAVLKTPATGQGVIAQRAYVNAHHDVAQKYIDSIMQAGVWAKNNRDQAIDIIIKNIKADNRDDVAHGFDFYMANTYTPTPFPDPKLWADAQDVLGAKSDKIKGFDVSKMVDPSFVQSAIDRGLNK
jgi:NitT/TauT family transport system substrate-binding protein